MLAHNFLDASTLCIPEPHRQALMKTLVMLETGKLTHVPMEAAVDLMSNAPFTGHFNMARWRATQECGSVCCIGGTAEIIGDVEFSGDAVKQESLRELFFADGAIAHNGLSRITPAQAARALRSYLTTGAANWKDALGEDT